MDREIKKSEGQVTAGISLHTDLLFPLSGHIIKLDENGCHDPSDRITEADNCGRVADRGCNIEIDLAEQDKGEQHDQHRSPGITGSSHGSCDNLVRAAEREHEDVHPEKHGSVADHIRLLVKDRDKARGEQEEDGGACERDNESEAHRDTGSFFGPRKVSGTEVLTHEGRGSLTDTLHRKKDELVDLRITAPSGHTARTEGVDVGLDIHV